MFKSALRDAIPLCTLSVALLAGCGGDSTGPEIPNVAGLYHGTESYAAVTCTPIRPPAGGTVVLEAFSDSSPWRIRQDGSQIAVTFPDFPNDPPIPGSVDREGNVSFELDFTYKEAPREGNRVFYVHKTVRNDLRRQEGGRLQGTGTYVNVFHEGSPTAPVFTTCSRGSTIALTRTGG